MRLLLFLLCFAAAGCSDGATEADRTAAPGSTVDTAVLSNPADLGSPTDTDDHNLPGDTVILDAPVGPTRVMDSAR
ncbi:hypothetical protein [Flaviaesturariibacter amylovorans]|uniref:Uncharacterized protein n=1 Tax=Flaviaesturariibacter amylovorans TaxID=1084520 RepID=A0ABP8HV14_9BACT